MRSAIAVALGMITLAFGSSADAAPKKARISHEKAALAQKGVEDAKGIYVRGDTAARKDFDKFLANAKAHGIDMIVLDAKDYDGLLTYDSKVPLARASGAVASPPIDDFGGAIAKARAHGLRVAIRVSCFEDEHMAKARPAMSVQSKAHRAYPIGWLDPSNPEVQSYVLDLVKEALSFKPDEIQLDYVRYPVLGIKNADFKLAERGLTQTKVITDFVHRVHEVTRAANVPLSLDVFGVIAFGKREDIDRLGQDPALLADECEVLAPMVYPSHYSPGFHGIDSPGDHPELVGMAVKAMREQIEARPQAASKKAALLRPWLQAMPWKSPTFDAGYVVREIQTSKDAGGSGYLLWNPGQVYGTSLQAVTVLKRDELNDEARKSHRTARAPAR